MRNNMSMILKLFENDLLLIIVVMVVLAIGAVA